MTRKQRSLYIIKISFYVLLYALAVAACFNHADARSISHKSVGQKEALSYEGVIFAFAEQEDDEEEGDTENHNPPFVYISEALPAIFLVSGTQGQVFLPQFPLQRERLHLLLRVLRI